MYNKKHTYIHSPQTNNHYFIVTYYLLNNILDIVYNAKMYYTHYSTILDFYRLLSFLIPRRVNTIRLVTLPLPYGISIY